MKIFKSNSIYTGYKLTEELSEDVRFGEVASPDDINNIRNFKFSEVEDVETKLTYLMERLPLWGVAEDLTYNLTVIDSHKSLSETFRVGSDLKVIKEHLSDYMDFLVKPDVIEIITSKEANIYSGVEGNDLNNYYDFSAKVKSDYYITDEEIKNIMEFDYAYVDLDLITSILTLAFTSEEELFLHQNFKILPNGTCLIGKYMAEIKKDFFIHAEKIREFAIQKGFFLDWNNPYNVYITIGQESSISEKEQKMEDKKEVTTAKITLERTSGRNTTRSLKRDSVFLEYNFELATVEKEYLSGYAISNIFEEDWYNLKEGRFEKLLKVLPIGEVKEDLGHNLEVTSNGDLFIGHNLAKIKENITSYQESFAKYSQEANKVILHLEEIE